MRSSIDQSKKILKIGQQKSSNEKRRQKSEKKNQIKYYYRVEQPERILLQPI